MEEKKRVEPIVLEYEDGKTYTLEFSRETVQMAERAGFSRDDFGDKLMVRVPQLFYYAFMMHHPTVSKEKTDQILFEDLGGVSEALSNRLTELFNAPYLYLFNETGEVKNPKLTVRL